MVVVYQRLNSHFQSPGHNPWSMLKLHLFSSQFVVYTSIVTIPVAYHCVLNKTLSSKWSCLIMANICVLLFSYMEVELSALTTAIYRHTLDLSKETLASNKMLLTSNFI